jgi:putative transposase
LKRVLFIETVKKAINQYGKPEILNMIRNTITSEEYISLLKENNIKISMDGKGRALDNQRIERFFQNL